MKIISYILATLLMSGVGSAYADSKKANDFKNKWQDQSLSWEDVEHFAQEEGSVNWYHWGGSPQLNSWVDRVLKPAMEDYDIKLKSIPVVATRDVVDLIQKNHASGRRIGEGDVDLVWINGDDFARIKKEDLVFGPFAHRLPNSKNFDFGKEDPRAVLNIKDFGVDTDYTEIPWGMEQYVCYVDRNRLEKQDTPLNYDALKTWLKDNPGRFTYVRPPHYLGSTFVQSALLGKAGEPVLVWQKQAHEFTLESLKMLLTPGFEYLREIEPYLLGGRGGENDYKQVIYAEDNANLQNLYRNGEIDMACEMGLFLPSNLIRDGIFSKTTETILFPSSGQLRNKNYLLIPANAPHPAAALVLANLMSSVKMQASKLRFLGYPVGIDAWKLTEDEQQNLKDVTPMPHGVSVEQLDDIAVPDINASLIPIINRIWAVYIGEHSLEPLDKIIENTYQKSMN